MDRVRRAVHLRADEAHTVVHPRRRGQARSSTRARSNLASIPSDVADRRDHLLVTRNGKPAAALISVDEHEALEATAELLSIPTRSPVTSCAAGSERCVRRGPAAIGSATRSSRTDPRCARWPSAIGPPRIAAIRGETASAATARRAVADRYRDDDV
jgi:prevent-host-death family protein